MRSQCIRTGSDGKADKFLSRFLTSATHRHSTRLLRLPPWLAQSYASVSTPAKPSQSEKDKPSSVEQFTLHKQRALARSSVFTQTSLEQELRYLKDPRKLADYIDILLHKDQFGKAYELVKKSSRDLPCTVSWNHLINFDMSTGRVGNACTLYNDVGKRRLEEIHITNTPRDEEESSKARCPDLYHHVPRARHVSQLPTIPRSCPLNLRVDVCG